MRVPLATGRAAGAVRPAATRTARAAVGRGKGDPERARAAAAPRRAATPRRIETTRAVRNRAAPGRTVETTPKAPTARGDARRPAAGRTESVTTLAAVAHGPAAAASRARTKRSVLHVAQTAVERRAAREEPDERAREGPDARVLSAVGVPHAVPAPRARGGMAREASSARSQVRSVAVASAVRDQSPRRPVSRAVGMRDRRHGPGAARGVLRAARVRTPGEGARDPGAASSVATTPVEGAGTRGGPVSEELPAVAAGGRTTGAASRSAVMTALRTSRGRERTPARESRTT